MPLDTFICGVCMTSFNDIGQFYEHKNGVCGASETKSEVGTQPEASEAIAVLNSTEDIGQIQLQAPTSIIEPIITCDQTAVSEALLADGNKIFQVGTGEPTVIILQGEIPNLNLDNAGHILAEMVEDKSNTELLAGMYKKRGRPGRPKKNKAETPPTPAPVKEKNEAELGEDGKLHCRLCKKSFTRQRVFNAHRCIALSEYVDFTSKDITSIAPEDNDLPQDDLDDAGALDMDYTDTEFKVPLNIKKETSDSEGEAVKEQDAVTEKLPMDETAGQANVTSVEEQSIKADKRLPLQIEGGPDTEGLSKETDKIGTLPIFLSDEDKAQFEQCLNVDLSGVDNMFRTHSIEQEANLNSAHLTRFSSNELSLYSCNICDKVFKSITHMRFHVLIHTDIRPFRCFKCNYSSNSRGNLYTHMRKHTGQYYHCDLCTFRTVNKSHLLEHQQIHQGIKQQCNICKKMYNTQKSLMSHIRKYHDNPKGRTYLSTFMQGRDMRGTTIIHQCHVCNRKFKKKSDRDRHLFVHDIKDMAIVQHCELCNYSASRVKYLEKHFQKHRCIYRCCKCEMMFLSSVKLVEHLTTSHTDSTNTMTWEQLFEESIASSLYLPEPDTTLPTAQKQLLNLPDELSEAGLAEVKLLNSGEDYLPLNTPDYYINKDAAVKVENNESPNKDLSVAMETECAVETVTLTEDRPLSDLDTHVMDHQTHENQNIHTTAGDSVVVENAETVADVDQMQLANGGEQMLAADLDTHTESNTDTALQDGIIDTDPVRADPNEIPGSMDRGTDNGVAVEETNGEVVGEISGIGLLENENHALSSTDNSLTDQTTMNEGAHVDTITEAALVKETCMTEEELQEKSKGQTMSANLLMHKLGFRSMTLRIFKKMRDTFGSEECEYCGRLFFSRIEYEPHVRTHTGDKPFMCPKCDFRSITRDNLKRHIDKEHENITYPCRQCAFVAYTRTQLWNHAMKHKGLKGLECPSCREQFETMTELKEHAEQIHPNANIEELNNLLSNKHKIQGKIGRRTYKCPHCDKVFVRASSELQKHMWIHEGIKPFKCPLCPYACRSKNNLQAHMLRHSKDKPFLCGDCGKAYKSKTALRWHVRSHAQGKLFKCAKCPYEATQGSHLKRHMETHEVIKRYTCGECQFSANTLGFLKVHYKRFHKDIDTSKLPIGGMPTPLQTIQDVNTEVYKCASCNYLFGNMSDLKRHLRTRHHLSSGIQIVQVEESETEAQAPITMEVMTEIPEEQVTHTVTDENLDEKTASAVNILQQIFGFPQNSTVTQEVVNSSIIGNPETIIVEQTGNEMYVTGETGTTTAEIDGNQYIIQYIPQTEVMQTGEGLSVVEIQGVESEVLTQTEPMVLNT